MGYSGEKIAYVLSGTDLLVKHTLRFEQYEFNTDIDFADTSSILVSEKPNIENDDFVLCKQGNDVLFAGVCKDAATAQDSGYTISLKAKECLFDRPIFIEDEELIASVGIEDFIQQAIYKNWIASDDMMDKPYISLQAVTHTPVFATVSTIGSTQDGHTYNLKTFLGNAMEYYHVFLDFDLKNDGLDITIRTDDAAAVKIDTSISDVVEYEETYKVDVLARLQVKWKVPDQEENGVVTVVGPLTDRIYYLLDDRSITTDKNHVRRVMGTTKAVYIETEKEEDMVQQVQNEFTSNSYEHKISFGLNKASKAYPSEEYYVGRLGQIMTKTGMKTSIITGRRIASDSGVVYLTFGKLKITLIEKMRGL